MIIREIRPADNKAIASIIRNSLEEFGANKPGTVYFDNTTDNLSELFQTKGSIYFIVEDDDQIIGGGGLYPTSGLKDGTVELVKMYLAPIARGRGIGRLLLQTCIDKARSMGYTQVYLETMPELVNAIALYDKMGFMRLSCASGDSGHTGCDIWMQLSLH